MQSQHPSSRMKLAIIGIGCRFPGNSNSPQQFFENLKQGRDCLTEIPTDRWNKDYYYDTDKSTSGKMIVRRGGFIEAIHDFDNEAFNMSAKEAMNIDPQQRILLETTYQALEDANLDYQGTDTGVFIGSGASDFTQLSTSNPFHVSEYTAPGGALSIHANRISYQFDLRGPSMAIDTACSASGTAMYLASKCIENGDCSQAIVGGVNILMNQSMTVAFSKLGVLSPEGMSKSFDASANGYVRSEGCGVVVVKPLEKALKDGNHIYCVLNSISSNEDGAQSPSLTMPSGEAQRVLIEKTLKIANVNPEDIFFVEAHATGTLVGDPIEINTLGSIYGRGRSESNPLRIGSVKTNIGHMEFASFMASLIKCALMIDREELLPSIHFSSPNPKIDFDRYFMKVQTCNEKFERDGKLFSISSFGFGGANICAILESPPRISHSNTYPKLQQPPYIYMTSALSKNALLERIQQLKSLSGIDQHQLMFNMNSKCMKASKYVSYGIGKSISEAKFVDPIRYPQRKEPIVFVFSGQGPQNIDMGRTLYRSFPVFKKVIDKCDFLYQQRAGFSIIHDIGLFGEKIGDKNIVNEIHVTLPGLIFIQIGLFELYKSIGVEPDAIIGHSFGEMCGIYASKACTLEEIISITVKRAELMKRLKGDIGTMIAIGCGEEEYSRMIKDAKIEGVWIAAINSSQSVTAGGYIESIHKLASVCNEKSIFNRILNVTNAYHTPLMSSLKKDAEKSFNEVLTKTYLPSVPVISTVTGEFWDTEFTPSYFWSNIENAVLFQQSVETALKRFGSNCIFLEMAPHPVLSMSIKQSGANNIIYSQHRSEDQQATLLTAAAKLQCYGYHLNWNSVVGCNDPLNNLPPYPFQRKTFYTENEIYREIRTPSQWGHLIGAKIVHHSKTFQQFLSTKSFSWIEDHVVQESVIFPASGYVEIALEGLGKDLRNIEIKNPMTVPTDSSFQLVQSTIDENNCITVFSKREGDSSWTEHAVARKGVPKTFQSVDELEHIINRCPTVLEKDSCYKRFEVMGLKYGPNFQCIEKLYQGDEESLGILTTCHLKNLNKFLLHPAVLDCCFQCFLGTLKSSAHTFLPTGIENLSIKHESMPSKLFVYCKCSEVTEKFIKGSISALDTEGNVIFNIDGFLCTVISKTNRKVERYYHTIWQTKKLPDYRPVLLSDFSKEKKQWSQFQSYIPLVKNKIKSIISSLEGSIFQREDIPTHIQEHLNWCKGIIESGTNEYEVNGLASFSIEMDVMDRVGKVYQDVLFNNINVMFNDDILPNLYAKGVLFKPTLDMMVDFIGQITDKERVFKILEIGSGTRTFTEKILPELKKNGLNVEYLCTEDEDAPYSGEKKFKDYSFVQYRKIDISKPLKEQGVKDESIDIVLSFENMYSSSKIRENLQHIKNAMVPNGIMISAILTKTNDFLNFIFGVFNTWWDSYHIEKPKHIGEQEWIDLFESQGFQGIETHSLDKDYPHSILIARKTLTSDHENNTHTANRSHSIYKPESMDEILSQVKQKINSGDESPVIIVTKSAQIDCNNPEDARYIGFGRVLANEYTNWKVRMIDLPSNISDKEEALWISRVANDVEKFETEFAIRDGEIFVPRIIEKHFNQQHTTPKQNQMFRLEISDGLVDNIKFHQVARTDDVPPGKVLIRVVASSLNFRDIMLAMKMLQYSSSLGLEFSGFVEKIGEGVTKFNVGDEVYGLGDHCLASHVVANEGLVVKKPAHISHEEACSIPIVFLTVYYSLFCKARVEKGNKVLVHSGAGGIGQAAIQLLLWRGCEIYCTVGSESKRKLLNERYGISNFANSHSLDWDKEIREMTPNGVDVVLNSLNGQHIEKGLNILSPCGSFIEIGKRDILENNQLSLAPFINNLSYFSCHLDFLLEKQPEYVGNILSTITDLFERKILSPFVDSVFAAKDIVSGIRYMQSGKHTGKIVINFEQKNYPAQIYQPIHIFNPQKTYILSGGLGAVGFEVARFMAANGARNICLLSRSGSLSNYQKRSLKEMEQNNTNIMISKTDVCNEEQVLQMYESLKNDGFPIVGGIIHLAMVLDDDAISKQSSCRFSKVCRPKIEGAKYLVEPLKKDGFNKDLDFIFFFSSISSVIGNPEQSNYAAANAFLDAYSVKLALQGYKAKAINLGAVDDVGVVATDYVLRKIMLARGLESLTTVSMVCEYLQKMIADDDILQAITPENFDTICEYSPAMAHRLEHLVGHVIDEERKGMVEMEVSGNVGQVLCRKIEKILQLDQNTIDESEKLTSYGVDSLLAVEISSMLSKSFSIKVSQMDILSGLTVKSLASKFGEKK